MKSRGLLQHMHFADNNRKMPGDAHFNFQVVVKGLKNVDLPACRSQDATSSSVLLLDATSEESTLKSILEYLIIY
jgi:hypothetical protein